MSACCDAISQRRAPAWLRSAREICAWILPSTGLVMMPKCPMCLAAYVTLWTGLGVSLPVATYLRWALVLLCVTSLLFLIVKRLTKKEIQQCNTR